MSDVDEIDLGTNPSITDTDLDGFGDSTEVNILNTDPLDGTTVIIDSDGDGLSDNDEINNIGTDPNNADTDNDGATDPIDLSPLDNQISGIDTDLDGIDDAWANFFYPSGLNLTNDLDGDSLTVLQEYVSQTSDDYFNERQIIQAPEPRIKFNRVTRIPLSYSVSDSNSNLPGIGIRIHFQSAAFSLFKIDAASAR